MREHSSSLAPQRWCGAFLTPAAKVGPSRGRANSSLQVRLRSPVTVRRDERGIPYIEAANDDDCTLHKATSLRAIVLWQMICSVARRAASFRNLWANDACAGQATSHVRFRPHHRSGRHESRPKFNRRHIVCKGERIIEFVD